MISFLETVEAREEAEKMTKEMIASSSVSFPPSEDYPISLSSSLSFAVLIAKPHSSNEHKILRGFSGTAEGRYTIPGYVPPCFSVNEWKETLKENDARIHELTELIDNGREELKDERKKLTEESIEKLNRLYSFSTWDGKHIPRPLNAPTGTGDCAGLKVINTALRKGWEIIGLVEFRIEEDGLHFMPPCSSRCGLLLPSMLGLDYIYADSSFAVINKEAGMLSVPGRGDDKLDSAAYRFHKLFPSSPEIAHTHRLDMDTSGLLVLAFTKEAHRNISMQFESRSVKKEYDAVLEGVLKEDEGVIDLPMRLDVERRPYQIIDMENGKRAVTRWPRLSVEVIDGRKCTRVRFYPETGRTHQLRVHSAAIGHPILGDRLYGERREGERLLLHSSAIEFNHPETCERVRFTSPAPF